MSKDLVVYAVRQADTASVVHGLPLSIEHHRGGFTVERQIRGSTEFGFSGDGPLQVERADLPTVVAAAGVGLRVSYELSVPGSAPSTVHRLMTRVARLLAAGGGGVVYDPQDDRVTWPRGGIRRQRLPAAERLSVVELQWFFRDDGAERSLSALFDVVQTWWPEATPRRFGDSEPLQHHWGREGLDGLHTLARREWGTVFWSSGRPFFGGTVSIQQKAKVASARVAIASLSLDARILATQAWREDVVEGFVAAADRMHCIYAQAQAERNWGYSGGRLWADARTDICYVRARTPDGTWLGLPPDPAWLAWLGEPYTALDVGMSAGRGRLLIAEGTPGGPGGPPMARLDVPQEWLARDGRRAQRIPGDV